jgi:Coenzyme PQQ synthesis protein D (PqqD)
MTPPDTMSDVSSLPLGRISVPQHVVYRSFPSETVVLNLQTGKYHGLNAIAGSMLDALVKAQCLRDAAAAVAVRYEQPQALVEKDMCELCQLLLDRGLVEIDACPAS